MKKPLVVLYFILASFTYVALISHSSGRALVGDEGNTGAPGDAGRTCITCHSSSNIMSLGTIELLNMDGSLVNSYLPGQEYTVKVSIDHTGSQTPSAYGFQMIALDEENTALAGFSSPDDNTQIITTSANRQYAEHKGANRNTNFFETKWTAPMDGSGTVTFYAGVNAVNLNGSPSGDGASLTSLSVELDNTTSSRDLNLAKISSYPNPFTNSITVEAEDNDEYIIKIFNIQGQEVMHSTTRDSKVLDLSDLVKGAYLMTYINEKGNSLSRKIIKI